MAAIEAVGKLVAAERRAAAIATIAGWWLAGRAIVFVTAIAVHRLGPHGYFPGLERQHALGVLATWDGRWYRLVASSGYLLVPGRQSDTAFFPMFPILLRGGHALGLGYYTTGVVLSNVALPVALGALYVLTRELFDEDLARRSAAYVAIFPTGIVFSMVYPESIVLALIALAALAALRDRWLLAAVCAAAAALARPEAMFVSLPLLAIAWQHRHELDRAHRGFALGAALAPPAAIASFGLYLGRTLHNPFAWSEAQRAWGRHFSPFGVAHAIGGLGTAFSNNAWVVREVVAVVFFLALVAVAVRVRVPWPWTVGAAAIVVLPLFSGAFDSVSRFALLAPAVFWGLAAVGRRPWLHRAIVVLSLGLLVVATATLPLMYP